MKREGAFAASDQPTICVLSASNLWMLLALAALALILATVGLYGVSATAAWARSRELVIRAAIRRGVP
jgi:hypothetical protein